MQPLLTLILAALVAGAALQIGLEAGLPAAEVLLPALAAAGVMGWLAVRERRAGPAGPPPEDLPAPLAGRLLVALLAAALIVRLPQLATRTTWEDEMWTLRNIYTSSWGELLRVAFDDYWPPLHYLLLNAVARLTDTSMVWLRLPSVIFGVLGVAAMYRLGLTLFGRRSVALAGSALLAGMTSHVLYSQEARVYAMQVLLVVLSAASFFPAWRERRVSPACVLATTLLVYSHSFSTAYFLAALAGFLAAAWWLWRDRQALARGLASLTLVALLALPLAAAFLWARLRRGIVVPTQWATGSDQWPGLGAFVEQYQGLAVRSWAGAGFMALLIGLALWEGWRSWRSPTAGDGDPINERQHSQALVFLLCWVVIPVLVSWTVTVATPMKTFGEIRYHMTVLPALCLLAAAGLPALRQRTARWAAAGLVVLLPASQLPRHFRTYAHPATDEAARIILAHGTDAETIYAGNGYRALGYYLRGSFPRIGSAEWDRLTAAHAHLADQHTQDSPKWGDTYAYEKLPPRIRYYSYYGFHAPAPRRNYERWVHEELARGGFQGTFWLVLDSRAPHFLPVFEAAGIACRDPERWSVRGLELRRCNPPPMPSGQGRLPPTGPGSQESDRAGHGR